MKVLLSVLLLSTSAVFGQDLVPQILPPTPEAASLTQYAEIPVSTHTGIPQIRIPLHTLALKEIAVPIEVAYYAGGIKVEETASRIGLGWSLHAGGMISRSLRGLPDELPQIGHRELVRDNLLQSYGIQDLKETPTLNPEAPITSNPQFKKAYSLYERILTQKLDVEPDLFSFNFGAFQGKLMLTGETDSRTGEGIAIPYPYQNVKFYFSTAYSGNARKIVSWRVILPNGYQYFFGKHPTLANRTAIDIQEFVFAGHHSSQTQRIQPYASGWYLVALYPPGVQPSSPNSHRHSLQFEYDSYAYRFSGKRYHSSRQIFLSGDPNTCPVQTLHTHAEQIITGSFLTNIIHPVGSVKFVYASLTRKDLPKQATDKALAEIQILGLDQEVQKTFAFHTSYFSTQTHDATLPTWQRYRLKLDQIQEIGQDGTTQNPYKFHYDSTYTLPHISSFAQDHWGFYNGSTDNSTLFPRFYFQGLQRVRAFSNRSPHEAAMKAGTLVSIQYPLGARTDFTFEGHRVFMKDFPFEKGGSSEHLYAELHGERLLLATEFQIQGHDTDPDYPEKPGTHLNLDFWLSTRSNTCEAPCECNWKVRGPNGCGIRLQFIPLSDSTLQPLTLDGVDSYESLTAQKSRITLFLPNGRYKMQIQKIDPHSLFANQVLCRLSGPPPNPGKAEVNAYNKLIGGLRIKRIRHSSGEGSGSSHKIIEYTYAQDEKGGKSSGVLIYPPRYHSTHQYYTHTQSPENPENEQATLTYSCDFLSLTASPQTNPSAGIHVGYRVVQERQFSGDYRKKNGHVEYQHLIFSDPVDKRYPYSPSFNRNSLISGHLHSHLIYASPQSSTLLKKRSPKIQETHFQYTFEEFGRMEGLKIGCLVQGPNGNCLQPIFDVYSLISGTQLPTTKVTKAFDQVYPHNPPFQKRERWFYESKAHTFPTRKESVYPDSSREETHIKYPDQQVPRVSPEIRNHMQDHNLWIPLEESRYLGYGPNKLTLTHSLLKEFDFTAEGTHGPVKPKAIWNRSSLSHPYERQLRFRYDSTGLNLVEFQPEGGIPSSIIWAYGNTMPIGVVRGLSYNQAHKQFRELSFPISHITSSYDGAYLEKALHRFQLSHPGLEVQSVGYSPTFQVNRFTQANGISQYFSYDEMGRLNEIRNHRKEKVASWYYHQAERP